ncbi:DUF6262 family protein [Streptomyces sp. NPDC059385]|uniref:DUF6262 family protein n=1 Tax=Streptomyces sp. NPDC059385 TaxID=3346817 RepID=UPI003675C939
MTGLPEHLRTATRSRSEGAEERARAALSSLSKNGKQINFTTVARVGGIGTDFLYRHPELRALVERHRAKGGGPGGSIAEPTTASSTSSAVRALAARLAQDKRLHQEEVAKLRKALEVAHGENLLLRRRLARYETD